MSPELEAVEAGPVAASHVARRNVLVYELACAHAACAGVFALRVTIVHDFDAHGEPPRVSVEHIAKRSH